MIGQDRHALLLTPESGHARALAVELHGSGLDARRQRAMSGLPDLLVREGMAVLMPQAAFPFQLRPELAPGFAWNIPGAPLPGRSQPETSLDDDLAWIEQRVRATQAELDLVDAPLFLTGYSGGARLASHLLVRGGCRWTAAGLVAGLRAIPGDHPPPPTISFHGLDDPINPYAGGSDTRWDMGVEEADARYAVAQNAAGALESHAIPGNAHAWPGSMDAHHLEAFGPAGTGIEASAMIAAFFMRHLTEQDR